MKITFDADIDYAELFFRSVPNYGVNLTEDVIQFRSDKDDSVVGYGFDRATETLIDCELIDDDTKIEFLKILRKGG